MRPHRHSPRFPSLRSGAGRADAGPAAARRRRKSKPLPSLTCVPSRLNVVVALLRSRSLSPTPTLVGVLPPRAAPTLRASPLLGAAVPRLRPCGPARRDDAACRALCGRFLPVRHFPTDPGRAPRQWAPYGPLRSPIVTAHGVGSATGWLSPARTELVRGAGSGGALRLTPTAASPLRPVPCVGNPGAARGRHRGR